MQGPSISLQCIQEIRIIVFYLRMGTSRERAIKLVTYLDCVQHLNDADWQLIDENLVLDSPDSVKMPRSTALRSCGMWYVQCQL
jgi:hypothetical protein